MVKQGDLWMYSNADPRYYTDTSQTVPNSEIPDESWHEVSRTGEYESLAGQYHTLKQWALEDREFVRNVKLHKQVSEPQWEEVTE